MDKVLLIDDDKKLGELLDIYFRQFDIQLTHYENPLKAIDFLKNHNLDVVILDVMLPDLNGFEVCKKIRTYSDIPIIMLTARGETSDKVLGLELGVDDYLPKPFESRELVARIKSLIRRSKKILQPQVKLSSLQILLDSQSRKALFNQQDLNLSTLEFELLKYFMLHPNQNLSRDKIMDELKGVDWDAYNRSIDVAISRLRQKLGDSAKTPVYLKTIWGEGYCFIAPVEEVV
jgi:DNA-binding response OmpR family regulator